MLLHNFRIAWKSLKRNPVLSTLIVLAIGIGIGISTTFGAVRHAFARDPIPQKSARLHYVRMDSWDPLKPYPGTDPTAPPSQVTYRDAVELMKSPIPTRHSATFKSRLTVYPESKELRPFKENVRLCVSDFFPMFDVPFRYGSGWDKAADAGPATVLVLSAEMNDKLFGGANSVGKIVRMEGRDFRVVGVLGKWDPGIKFYDLTQNYTEQPENFFIPFELIRPMQLRTAGNSDGWKSPPDPSFEGFLQSETAFVQFWAELKDKPALAAYEDHVRSYVLEQKKVGRFPRPVNNRITPLLGLMKEFNVVPQQATALLVISLLFLTVCSVNLVGLLLAKFLARAPEVGVRRALGASRTDIFLQHLVECELVGILGGALGLGLSALGIALMNTFMKTMSSRGDFFRLDLTALGMALGLSLLAGLAAGLYPAWRICRIAPAVQLKVS